MKIDLFALLFFNLVFVNSFSQNVMDDSSYYFKTTEEGIYKIRNPYQHPIQGFVSSRGISYVPYYDPEENVFYVYGEKGSVYQLHPRGAETHIKFKRKIEINNKSIYKYTLNGVSGNWLHALINPDEEYREVLNPGIPINGIKDSITLYMYNFESQKAETDISLNGKTHTVTIPGKGEYAITLQYPLNNGTLQIQIYSPFNSLAIIKYEYDEINRAIYLQKPFYKITVDSAYSYRPLIDINFSYYSFVKGKLKRVEFGKEGHVLTNILVQKNSSIEMLELFELEGVDYKDADYILVTTRELLKETASLVSVLKSKNPDYTYKTIDVQTIFNSFSNSEKSAEAIRIYLHLLSPKYVLLIGDANERENSNNNTIPTFYFNQAEQNSRIASDYKFTYLNNYTEPKFAIGRIPLCNAVDLSIYTNKLRLFLSKSQKGSALVMDDEQLLKSNRLPASYSIYKKQNHNFLYNFFYNDFIDEINLKRPKIVMHVGHGSFTGWNKKEKIEIDEFEDLNRGRLFNVIDLSCWTGEFANINNDGFSEKLLKLQKTGGVNIVSYTGFSSIRSYLPISDFIFKYINNLDIGTLLNNLKAELSGNGMLSFDDVHSLNLMGIPSLYFYP